MFPRNVRSLSFCRNYTFSTSYRSDCTSFFLCVANIFPSIFVADKSSRNVVFFQNVGELSASDRSGRRRLITQQIVDQIDGMCPRDGRFLQHKSPLSFQDTSGLFLRCFKSREACSFHFFADGYEEIEVDVVAVWKEGFVYTNRLPTGVQQKITMTKGMKNLNSETKTLTAKHTVGSTLESGDKFKIAKVTVSYSFSREESQVSMTQTEVYSSQVTEHTVTVPPTSTFTRWQLNADVAGADIEYMHLIDEVTPIGATESIPQVIRSRAKILVGRQIHLGTTEIRIKHAERKEYMTVIERKSWPAATLGKSNLFKFVLFEDSTGIRIKTLNTMHPGYEWAYSSDQGGIYFDESSDNPKQRWALSKALPLRHGDVVTFMNKYFTRNGLCYDDGPATNVYCLEKREDKWILEVVKP